MYSFSKMNRKELRHAVKRAEPSIFEDLLRFLEDDPLTFGSGYTKEKIWKYIKRYKLSSNDLKRIENVALQYLYRPMSVEFRYMCQTMCVIASKRFWTEIKTHLKSENELVSLNASCLFPYSESMNAGEKRRLAWKQHKSYRLLKWFESQANIDEHKTP